MVSRGRVLKEARVATLFAQAENEKRRHYEKHGAEVPVETLIASEFGCFNKGLDELVRSVAKRSTRNPSDAAIVRTFWVRNIVFDQARAAAAIASASSKASRGDFDKTEQSVRFATWLQSPFAKHSDDEFLAGLRHLEAGGRSSRPE